MNEDHNRRTTDPLIIEMHGTLQRLDQRMDDTHRWFKEAHEAQEKQIDGLDKRLKPVEDFHSTAKILKWPAIGIAAPTLAGVGALVWEKIKHTIGGGH